ncbi:hypothetical protein Dimus_014324 [Dionaea muscipula]
MANKSALLLKEGNAKTDNHLLAMLIEHGFDIVTVTMSNYNEALSEFGGGKHYDVVFLLEIENGPEVAESLKKMGIHTMIYGIISNNEDLDDYKVVGEWVAAGVKSLFARPLTEPLMVDVIEETLCGDGIIPDEPDDTLSMDDIIPDEPDDTLSMDDIIPESEQPDLLAADLPSFLVKCMWHASSEAKSALMLKEGNTNIDRHLLATLIKHDFDIVTMSDYKEALSEFGGGKHYDVVFLDIVNGLEVAESLKKMGIETMIYGIISNNKGLYDPKVVGEWKAAGVKSVFSKPLMAYDIEYTLCMDGIIPKSSEEMG